MGILRTDVVSHSQLSNGNASVLFDGTADRLTIPSHSSFAFGTADWTVEGWFYFTSITGQQTLVGDTYGNTAGWYLYKQSNHRLGVYYSSIVVDGSATIETDRWYHFAFVRNSGMTRIYINGELDAEGADTTNATTTQYYIGDTAQSSGEFFGNISNLRITRTAVYKDNFTVPKFKLKEIPGTILLCCQSSSSTTEATVSVPGTLTTGGDPTATAFGPGLKEDITDTGVVFDGVTTFDSQAFMVPPSGKTTERNRGRGLIGQGSNTTSPSNVKAISFIEIQSGGTAFDFGDSTNGSMYAMTAVSSSTRAVFAGGHTSQSSPYPTTNLIEFVTIANTSNCTDFGDLDVAAANRTGVSNQTRGLIAGGYSPNTRQIDKITIATLGNAGDFGNLTDQGFYGMNQGGMVSSTTRGLFAGGSGNSAPVAVNTITFVLIASDSNSTDFGDLTHTNGYFNVGNSNGTRGIFMGGADIDSPYAVTDQIDFVTIATAGNATDFGSLSTGRYAAMGASNSTRGVIAGGRISPAPSLPATNLMEFVNIASTGSGSSFGELIEPERSGAGCSDSHGGLE